jgi:hypothetical protein
LALQLHDVLAAAGGIPLTASYCCPSSYLMKNSKSVRNTAATANQQQDSSSSSQFVGLPLDYVNQPELSDARISGWSQRLLLQLQEEHPGKHQTAMQVVPLSCM